MSDASAATIQGAGGSGRTPIAPHFTGAPGQRAADVAAALLSNKRHRPRELIVEVPLEMADGLRQTFETEYGVKIREAGAIELARTRIWHITLAPRQNLQGILTQFLQDNRILTAQPDYIYTPVQGAPQGTGALSPSSTGLASRPGPKALREARALPTGTGVKLAIIDTCVEHEHSELQGSIASSFDAIRSARTGCQPENHGTAVASLIAGHSHLHGTAAGASIMPVRAFAFTREENEIAATSLDIAQAIDWAALSGARIMNLSFTGPADPLIERTVAAAYRKNIVLVAAAGNAGPDSPPLYPAAYPETIAVTATDGRHGIYSSANRGEYICVSARGVDVVVAHVNNTYATESGTSFAAAKVSGVVAALLEKRPNASPEEVRAALQYTAIVVQGGDRNSVGHGLVNAAAAVTFIETSVPR